MYIVIYFIASGARREFGPMTWEKALVIWDRARKAQLRCGIYNVTERA